MARYVSPPSLENLVLDVLVKCFTDIVQRTVTAENELPELVVEKTCKMLGKRMKDVRRRLGVFYLKLRKLKKQLVNEPCIENPLIPFYEETWGAMQEAVEVICQQRTALRKCKREVENESDEINNYNKISQCFLMLLNFLIEFTHDQECKRVELNRRLPRNSDDVNIDCELCEGIRETLEATVTDISDMRSKVTTYMQHRTQLQNLVKNTVPPFLADKFIQKFNERLENLLKESDDDEIDPREVSRRIEYSGLMGAIIHPAVTTLDLESCHMTSCGISRELSSFNSIVVLKLCELRYSDYNEPVDDGRRRSLIDQMISSGLQAAKNLQVFHYYACTNDVMAAVAKNCKRLRCLNVKGSQCLNDGSIKSFAKLRYLEEVNIMRTGIEEGLSKIINGMDRSVVSMSATETTKSSLILKSLSCNISSNAQISLIATKLCNILDLKICVYCFTGTCNFSDLNKLQFLMSLSFKICEFSDIEEILERKGRELSQLTLEFAINVDINFISMNCPVLTDLSLEFCSSNLNPPQPDEVFLPELRNLSLRFSLDESSTKILLCTCPKLTAVHIQNEFVLDISSVLKRNSFEYLEEITLHTFRLPVEHLRELVYQCGKLNKFEYIIIGATDSNYNSMMKEFLREVKTNFPGLITDIPEKE